MRRASWCLPISRGRIDLACFCVVRLCFVALSCIGIGSVRMGVVWTCVEREWEAFGLVEA